MLCVKGNLLRIMMHAINSFLLLQYINHFVSTKIAANTPRPLHACFPTFGGWEREKPLVTQTWVNYVALGQCKTIFRSSSLPASRQTRRSKSENSLACIHTKVVGTIFYNFMASQNKRHETAFLYTNSLLHVLTNK